MSDLCCSPLHYIVGRQLNKLPRQKDRKERQIELEIGKLPKDKKRQRMQQSKLKFAEH